MVNRPKQIGTAAETAVVRAARRLGFPNADRLTLTGNHDRGDVGLCPGVVLEVKGGEAARSHSDRDVERWLAETETERRNAGAAVTFLVVQRRGVGAPNAQRWHAYWRHGWIADLRGYPDDLRDAITDHAIVRMSLESSLAQLRAVGYGNPLQEKP